MRNSSGSVCLSLPLQSYALNVANVQHALYHIKGATSGKGMARHARPTDWITQQQWML